MYVHTYVCACETQKDVHREQQLKVYIRMYVRTYIHVCNVQYIRSYVCIYLLYISKGFHI